MGLIEIVELAEVPWVASTLAGWHHAEWGHLYNDWDRAAAEAELAAMTVAGAIPTTWVAFSGSGRAVDDIVGSVSLIDDDDLPSHRHLRPWLASLYVVPAARGEGIGRALVERVLTAARRMGEPRVHLFTAGQDAYYEALGWTTIDRAEARGEPVAVMAFDLL
jgi:GNAT superfamily N-acetyltransferase